LVECIEGRIVTDFDIAHINEQEVNVAVVFVNPDVAHKSAEELNELATALQWCGPVDFGRRLTSTRFFKVRAALTRNCR
jgi:hypothetical protein